MSQPLVAKMDAEIAAIDKFVATGEVTQEQREKLISVMSKRINIHDHYISYFFDAYHKEEIIMDVFIFEKIHKQCLINLKEEGYDV